jgi:hypothetical protein
MSKKWTLLDCLFWLLLSSVIFIGSGWYLERNLPAGMADFKAVYYGARCVLQHSDPYNKGDFLHVYREEGGQLPSNPVELQTFYRAIPICINLPTSLFLMVPLAMLAWGPAHVLWMLLLAGGLVLAAFLTWNLAENFSPGVSLFLICIVLANCEVLFMLGNLAGFAVGLCIVAVWCFLKQRFVLAGILCLALSLAIKPHDVGLVWLYFLLAGGVHRKRALQTLLVTGVLCMLAFLWVSHVAPHWIGELNANLSATSAHGDLNDPGPTSLSFRYADTIIDLQSSISVFRDDPRIYNPASYVLCGALLMVWTVRTIRSQFSQRRAWLALAAIAALSMLPVYHRQHDAKLLLLTIPACAMLWAEGGPIRWGALLVTTAGVVLTGDFPMLFSCVFWNNLHVDLTRISGQMLTVVMLRPASIVLLAMSIFYLWVYLRRDPGRNAATLGGPEKTPSSLLRA